MKTVPTSEDVKVAISSITVANTTADANSDKEGVQLPTTENLLTGEAYNGNVLDALAIRVSKTEYETGYKLKDGSTNATLNDAGYSLTPEVGIVKKDSTDVHEAATYITSTDADTAHKYVNKIMPNSVTNTTTDVVALTNGLVYFYLPADGKALTLTFDIYLDGANAKCYDVLKGQTFTVSLGFNTVTTA